MTSSANKCDSDQGRMINRVIALERKAEVKFCACVLETLRKDRKRHVCTKWTRLFCIPLEALGADTMLAFLFLDSSAPGRESAGSDRLTWPEKFELADWGSEVYAVSLLSYSPVSIRSTFIPFSCSWPSSSQNGLHHDLHVEAWGEGGGDMQSVLQSNQVCCGHSSRYHLVTMTPWIRDTFTLHLSFYWLILTNDSNTCNSSVAAPALFEEYSSN